MDFSAHPLEILSAMITPAVLISACGTLAFSTSSRIGRVVDRVRSLADRIERAREIPEPTAAGAARHGHEIDQLEQLSRRALLLRSALTSLYNALGLFVATSIAIGLVAVTDRRLGWIPVATGLAGATVLLWGSVLLVREARLAVASTLQEMEFAKAIARGQAA